MSTDKEKIIESLLLKTVKNGATWAEEESAKVMAAKLAMKYGLSVAAIKARVESPNFGASTRTLASRGVTPHGSSFVGKWAEQQWAEQQAAARQKDSRYSKAWEDAKRQASQPTPRPKSSTPRPRPTRAKTSAGNNYNPFGTYGHGFDNEGEYKTVQDFVEAMLKRTTSSYESIAMESQQRFGGKTSAKSVASVACRMKKRGIEIPKHKRSK